MFLPFVIVRLALSFGQSNALPYDEGQVSWNLNQNQTATNPLEYWGQWERHSTPLLSDLFDFNR